MRLTRRGWGALAIVVVAIVLAWAFGQRSLNAVAAPTLAALVVAGLLLWRADPPTVAYEDPRSGFPGERRTLAFTVEGDGLATVRQSLPAGLTAPGIDATVTLPHRFEQETTLETRGVYEIGSPEIRQRDPLGLVERRVESGARTELVVYPQVYALADPTVGGLLADPATAERQEFDRLREYVPGDPLKNVHWKSSAKYDDFLVMEFAPADRTETISVAAEAGRDRTDRMAAAAATLVDAALEAGLTVEVSVPDGYLPPGKGNVHRENVLRLLAGTGHGSVEESFRAGADVAISAGTDATYVRLPEGRRPFASLVTGREQSTEADAAAGGVSA